MCDADKINKLQDALLAYLDSETDYADLEAADRHLRDLANALCVRLENRKRRLRGEDVREANHAQADDDLGSTLSVLSLMSDRGLLKKYLSADSLGAITGMLDAVAEKSMMASGLRKKDMAVFLRNSGDTDLELDRQRRVEELADKKDK